MTSHYFRNILDPNSSIKYRSKLPREIRLEVIRKWLQGKIRDQIAHEVHIGAGTVSGIVRDNRKDDPESDLLREVALNLKTRGLDIRSFAPLLRLREVLNEKGWLLDVNQGEAKEEEHGDLGQVVETKMESFIGSSKCFALNKTYR